MAHIRTRAIRFAVTRFSTRATNTPVALTLEARWSPPAGFFLRTFPRIFMRFSRERLVGRLESNSRRRSLLRTNHRRIFRFFCAGPRGRSRARKYLSRIQQTGYAKNRQAADHRKISLILQRKTFCINDLTAVSRAAFSAQTRAAFSTGPTQFSRYACRP